MKKLLLSLFVLVLSVSTTFSQGIEKTKDKLIKIAEQHGFAGQLDQTWQDLRNADKQAAIIEQVGNNNNAIITQDGTNLFAYILQDGNNLNADLTIKGSGNNAIIKQKGNDLFSEVKLTGRNNDFKLLQAGSDLHNHIKLLNVTGMNVQFLQTEAKFYYSQNGGNGVPLNIKTSQTVPKIIVRNH